MKLLKASRLIGLTMIIVMVMFLASQPVTAQFVGIMATAWSPDGSKIAIAGVSGLLQIRDTANQLIRTFTGLSTDITTVDWSPNSTKIVLGGNDGLVRVWDINTGQELGTLTGFDGYIQEVNWSPDSSKILATGRSTLNTLIIWNASTFQQIACRNAGEAWGARWSPDSTKIAVSQGAGYVSIYLPTLSNPLTSYSVDSSVVSTNWSADGTKIVAGTSILGSDQNKIKIWDVSTGNLIATYAGHMDMVSAVAFSPNGQQIASASNDGSVRVWNVATGQQVGSFTKPQSLTTSIAWSPNSSQLAFGGASGTLQIESAPGVATAPPTPTPTATATATETRIAEAIIERVGRLLT